jgi:hypothetical protein
MKTNMELPITNGKCLTRKWEGKQVFKGICILLIMCYTGWNVCEKEHPCHKWERVKPGRRKHGKGQKTRKK